MAAYTDYNIVMRGMVLVDLSAVVTTVYVQGRTCRFAPKG